MNIGVIGAGKIGGTVGVLWAKAGHLIRFGTRHPESLGPLLAEAGPNASAGSPEESAHFGEIIFCSVPYGAWPSLAPALAALVSGKAVLDSANLHPERDGDFARAAIAAGEGAGVPVARLFRRPAGASLQLGLLQNLADGGASRRRARRDPARGRRRRGARSGRPSGPGRGVRAGRRGAARPRALLRSRDPGLQHRHERRGAGPSARRRSFAVTSRWRCHRRLDRDMEHVRRDGAL